MLKFKYNGETFECDEKAATDYRVLKSMSKMGTNPAAFFDGFERIFSGKDEEYAEKVGGSIEEMGNLLSAAVEAVGDAAKK